MQRSFEVYDGGELRPRKGCSCGGRRQNANSWGDSQVCCFENKDLTKDLGEINPQTASHILLGEILWFEEENGEKVGLFCRDLKESMGFGGDSGQPGPSLTGSHA
jgi:hypothetical protein